MVTKFIGLKVVLRLLQWLYIDYRGGLLYTAKPRFTVLLDLPGLIPFPHVDTYVALEITLEFAIRQLYIQTFKCTRPTLSLAPNECCKSFQCCKIKGTNLIRC